MPKDNQKNWQKGIEASYTILGSLALFGFFGYWLDQKRENDSFWLMGGLLLGAVVGLYQLAKYTVKK